MNSFNGVGNLVRDPESSVTQSGVDVCKFTIAINCGKDESGRSIADFIPVKAKERKAALCREYLRKGRKVGITGRLKTYSFRDQEGQNRSGFYIALDDITFLASGDANKPNLGDVHSDDGVVHHDVGSGFVKVDDDELPF